VRTGFLVLTIKRLNEGQDVMTETDSTGTRSRSRVVLGVSRVTQNQMEMQQITEVRWYYHRFLPQHTEAPIHESRVSWTSWKPTTRLRLI